MSYEVAITHECVADLQTRSIGPASLKSSHRDLILQMQNIDIAYSPKYPCQPASKRKSNVALRR